ncbi:zinc finger protein 91-like isoform X2 [Chiloscyllium plagiosum]|uniref:zinc finger protein 91-like isoform X2 n=1 Tax=Chiloscyllium plagiosum TaxID=36176 RepID=UPI001CB7B818|nr:zinc finger protein 91-like isoform X2 [Chiloscyllium plagiosum]
MNSQEPHQARSQDTHPITEEDSVESNEIAFLVGEDGQLHSLQDESHKDWNPENRLIQKNGIQSPRNGLAKESYLPHPANMQNVECHIFTPTNSCQQHYQNNVLQKNSENVNGDNRDWGCTAVNQKIKESGPVLWSGSSELPTVYQFTALQDSPIVDSQIQNHHSDDMVCNICGKRYKYMSSFWKHRRDHETKGELVTAFSSRPDAASKSIGDRFRRLCPQREINPESGFKPIMMKMEKANPANFHHLPQFDFCSYRNWPLSDSWQEKFHNKGCSSVAIRPSVIKTEEAIPYCIMGKVSPPSNFNITSSDHLPAFQPRPLPDYFFSCDFCGKKYKYKSSFWKHIEDHKNYVVDSTVSDQGWNQITGSQLTEKQADNTEQLVRKVIIDDQHYNSLPIRDDKQQVQTANKQCHLDFDHKHRLHNDPIRESDLSIGQFNNICQLCGVIFSRKSGLADHIQFVHQRCRPHVCILCDQKFRRPSELKRHVEQHHDNCLADVQISNVKSVKSMCVVENGLLKSPDEVKFVKDAINQVKTGRSRTVRNKKTIKRPKRVHRCSLCGNKYLYYSILWKHRLMHGGKKKHFCLLCGSGFFRSKDLDIHFKSIHLQAFKFKCPHCEKGFNRPIDAQKHIIIRHTDLKNFICRICNRNTETASALQNHIKKYHSPKVPCTHCDFLSGNKLQF